MTGFVTNTVNSLQFLCGILLTTVGRKWSADCVFARNTQLFLTSVLSGPMNYFITDEDIMDKITPNTSKFPPVETSLAVQWL